MAWSPPMRRIPRAASLLLGLGLALPGRASATPVDACESSIESAAAKFLQCRLTAEAKYTRTLDDSVRLAAVVKCSDKFLSGVAAAKARNGAANCTPVAADDIEGLRAACSDAIEAAAGADGSVGCPCAPTVTP